MRARRGGESTEDEPAVVATIAAESGRIDTADAFSRLAARHLDSAYRLASVVLGDPTEAEDAAHDAAVLAWRHFGTLRDPERFEQWFCRIVLNVCRDRLRRQRRRPVAELPSQETQTALRAPDQAGRLVTRDALDRAFVRLEPDHQIVVALRFYRDLTVEEIARRLAIPEGTVKSRLHHALRRLRAEMERQGWRDEVSADRQGTR
jgi:RNA polymerase sigma-70 factor, ECF subfamily